MVYKCVFEENSGKIDNTKEEATAHIDNLSVISHQKRVAVIDHLKIMKIRFVAVAAGERVDHRIGRVHHAKIIIAEHII